MLGHISPRIYTASGDITNAHIHNSDVLIAQTAGICLSLPAGVRSQVNKQFRLVNNSAGPIALAVKPAGLFIRGTTAMAIPAYGAIDCRLVETSAATYKWKVTGDYEEAVKGTFTPVATWAGSAPTEGTHYGEYYFIDGVCFFNVTLNVTDGGGSTGLSSFNGLPFVPADTDSWIPVEMTITVDGTPTKCKAYVDATTDAAASRVVTCLASATLTDDTVGKVECSGFFEVAGFMPFVPPETWGTATPATLARVCRWKKLGKVGVGYYTGTSTDSNAVSSAKIGCPFPVPDNNSYCAVTALEKAGGGGATYSFPVGYLDQTDGTAGNRAFNFRAFTAGTDAQAWGLWFAFTVECEPWTSFTHTITWGTGTPASYVPVGKFTTFGGLCFLSVWGHSTDGNGATSYIGTMPMPAYKGSNVKPILMGYQLQNATYSECAPRIDNTQSVHASRTVSLTIFTTATDAQAVDVCIGGWFAVG